MPLRFFFFPFLSLYWSHNLFLPLCLLPSLQAWVISSPVSWSTGPSTSRGSASPASRRCAGTSSSCSRTSPTSPCPGRPTSTSPGKHSSLVRALSLHQCELVKARDLGLERLEGGRESVQSVSVSKLSCSCQYFISARCFSLEFCCCHGDKAFHIIGLSLETQDDNNHTDNNIDTYSINVLESWLQSLGKWSH